MGTKAKRRFDVDEIHHCDREPQMMPPNSPTSSFDHQRSENAFKRRIGILLITLGIMGVIFIVYNIFMLLGFSAQDPEKLPIIGTLMKYSKMDEDMIIYGRPFRLSASAYYILGVFAYLFVIRILESLTRGLLTTGANLLDHEISNFLSKLKSEIKRLKKMVDKGIKRKDPSDL